jgi:hypothetical protein
MLKNDSKGRCRAQSQKNNYASGCPASLNYGFSSQLVFVAKFFPVASDYVGGNSAITAGQISRSNQAVSYKAAFWKVFRLTLVGQEAGVSRWGWSSPSSHNSLFGFKGERVFSVDAPYGAPVQSGKPEYVVDNNFGFGNSDAWIPKKQPSKKAKPNVNPDFCQQNGDRFGSKRDSSNSRKDNGQNGHDFARAGLKQLGIHSVSFTQSAAEVGAVL